MRLLLPCLVLLTRTCWCQNPSVAGTSGGNANGRACVFPFTYKGIQYYNCITLNEPNNKPWCATIADYNTFKQWGYCQLVFTAVQTKNGNGNKAKCVFPFRFRGISYYSCITLNQDNKKPWCGVTANYDTDKRWGECVLYPQIATTGGNGGNKDCVFPFRFEGQDISGCLQDASRGPWCSVTDNYDRDKRWGVCALTFSGCSNTYQQFTNSLSYGGQGQPSAQNRAGCQSLCDADANCAGYDYDFNNGLSTRCFLHLNLNNFNSRRPASNVDEYVLTNRCGGVVTTGGNTGTSSDSCYFPYQYKGKFYASCNSGSWYGPWCAVTSNYDSDKLWGDCTNIPTQ